MTTTTTTGATPFEALFAPVAPPPELAAAASEQGWPAGLLERLVNLRIRRADIEWWLDHPEHTDIGDIDRVARNNERLMSGTMHHRIASVADDERLVDLFANSPEAIGDWDVTVERGPYPFAQMRLQEHPYMHVLEDRGVILAAMAASARATVVGGRRTSAYWRGAFRVRRECRGIGMSWLVQGPPPAEAWWGRVNYYYVRPQNVGALGWIRALNPGTHALDPQEQRDAPGLPVTVLAYPARAFEGDASGIRRARRSDARACVALINRTHRGQDLFRPYTDGFLASRLEDGCWGEKPEWWQRVYGWEDYRVFEEQGRIVACGGLWDRGRDMRERWRHRESGDEHVVASTGLMDFGYAEGREDAMAHLVEFLLGETGRLGRDHMLVPIEQLPALADRLGHLSPAPEVRSLIEPSEVGLRRVHTDLAYW